LTGLRFGSVPYLNARPLLEGLEAEVGEIAVAVPSELTRLLRAGRLDVALAPVVAAFDAPDFAIVPGAAVGARGPVESVLLFCRKPPAGCRTVALDLSSRTSANLVRVLFAERWRAAPVFGTRDPDPDLDRNPADGVLLIGDPALQARWAGPPPVDLAEEWLRWTGLPFVFACWIARDAATARAAEPFVRRAIARGRAALDRIADDGARELGADPARMRVYLRDRLSFDFGDAERRGLEMFRAAWDRLPVRS
jgi:predicted solute-binding protein